MRFEACDASPHFYCVRGLTKALRSYIQYSVRSSHRYFENGKWHVHRSQVLAVTELGYGQVSHVDYSALDEDLQIKIAQAKTSWVRGGHEPVFLTQKSTRESALRTLHLQPDAPDSVVKAVWRHLAATHHPDKGGDAEKFKLYLEAYNTLKR